MSSPSSPNAIVTDMDLFVSSDKMYLHPVSSPTELLVIDRLTHYISIVGYEASIIPSNSERKLIYGVIGIIGLIAGPYLVVITAVSQVGTVAGQPVMKIESTDVIPFPKTTLHLTEEQVSFNSSYLAMAKRVLGTEYFYYSPSYDISHSMQRLANFPPEFKMMPMIDRSDENFVWNHHLLKDLSSREPEFKKYCLPIIHGFVSIKSVTVNGNTFSWTLISRRSVHRAGTRLLIRGVNSEGHPANFVETEQIVEYSKSPNGSGGRCSHVQVRGSIPLYWSQMPNLKYKPPPTPISGVNQIDVCRKHLNDLVSAYGSPDRSSVVLVNLINQTGAEGRMEEEMRKTLDTIRNPAVKYVPFDFHHECRKMRWDRLSLLMERICRDIDDFGWFHSTEETILSEQKGIFRVNCIDSLDRTNVVQGLIGRRVLEHQLRRIGIFMPTESITSHSTFEYLYRNVWADNADIISIQYSGTGALKTDFTRTGKRTHLGVIMDGVNSLTRYVKNNFYDGGRQDATDLFLGNYEVNPGEGRSVKCPLDQKKDWKFLSLPLILLWAVAMFFITLLIPAEHTTETLIYLLFWLAMIAGTLFVIVIFGTEFVDYPKLTDIRPKKSNKKE